jgi:hypothetical protein
MGPRPQREQVSVSVSVTVLVQTGELMRAGCHVTSPRGVPIHSNGVRDAPRVAVDARLGERPKQLVLWPSTGLLRAVAPRWTTRVRTAAHRRDSVQPGSADRGNMSDLDIDRLRGIRRLTVDNAAQYIEIETLDGRVVRDGLVTLDDPALRRSTFFVEDAVAVMDVEGIGEVTAEVGGPLGRFDPVDPRPVVYLDQNHWVSLSRFAEGSERLVESEREAAAAITELAQQRKIILPLSAAHYVETARADGKWRRDLAAVMLRLSRGWVMRHPMSVEASELGVTFRGVAKSPTPYPPFRSVFSLEPSDIWGLPEEERRHRSSGDLPPAMADLVNRLSALASFYSVLAEDSRTVEGQVEAQNWASSHQGLGEHMGGNSLVTPYRRAVTRAKLVSAMGDSPAKAALRAGMTVEEWRNWLGLLSDDAPCESDFPEMPYIGRLREVIHYRLLNANEKWEGNDLHDLLFLSCAAAYGDVVVGERKHASYLQRAARVIPGGASVTRNLRSAMPAVEAAMELRAGVDSAISDA